jgi:hypothetical protein
MMGRFRWDNEERGNRYWMEGEEENAECPMRRERQLSTCGTDVGNETEGEKGTGRNTE